MAKIPKNTIDPTLAALDAAMEAQPQKARAYLGMSQIGAACERSLWYSFRWAVEPAFGAITLRRFQDGHLSEDIMAGRLRLVDGIDLMTHDANGNQFGFSDHGGHFSGHVDGVIHGLLHAPKTHAVWEHKCVNEDKFRKLNKLKDDLGEKNALKEWDEVYYGQAMCYCHYTGLDRHWLTVSTAGSRDNTSCYTEHNPQRAQELIARAKRVITANEPPPGVSDDPAFFVCKWCDFSAVCHERKLPAVNCRTCLHSTPVVDDSTDAKWHCALADCHIPLEEARKPQPCHRYIPSLVKFAKPVDVVEEVDVVYEFEDGRKFVNGQSDGAYSSIELGNANPELIGDPNVEGLRARLGGEFVPVPEADLETAITDDEVPF